MLITRSDNLIIGFWQITMDPMNKTAPPSLAIPGPKPSSVKERALSPMKPTLSNSNKNNVGKNKTDTAEGVREEKPNKNALNNDPCSCGDPIINPRCSPEPGDFSWDIFEDLP
jgi:hypothetical protein